MKFYVIKCDFCGKEDRTSIGTSPIANTPKDEWRVVRGVKDDRENWVHTEDHLCPDCYKRMKDFGKQHLTISSPKGGAE